MKILTIIIPAYNCAKYIDNLFNHVPFKQIYDDIEFIIVDDGSKDDTWNKLKAIQERYGNQVIKIYTKENGNWGSVHNFAKKVPIDGRFVKTLDSDDYLDSYALIKFISFLKTLPNNIDLVFSNVNFIDSKDNIMTQKFYDRLFKKQIFKIDEVKLTKLSVLTVHAFTIRKEIYQNIPDLPTHMSYMDSVFIFLLINAAKKCAFFQYAPLYQYQCGNEEQTISITNFSKHSDWIKVMLETEAKYAIEYNMFKNNSKAKNKILCQMIQLGYFHYCYAVTNKYEISNKQKSYILYKEIIELKNILGNYNFKKYFTDFSINILLLLHCKLLPHFVNIASLTINSGYLKATKKDGKRKNTSWYLKNNKKKEKINEKQ